MFRPFLCLLLILFANLNSAKRSREHYKLPTLPSEESDSPLQKLEGTKHIWSPWSPKLEGTRPTDPQGGCAYAVILFTYDMTFLFSQVLGVVERRTRASVLYRFCIDNVDYICLHSTQDDRDWRLGSDNCVRHNIASRDGHVGVIFTGEIVLKASLNFSQPTRPVIIMVYL